MRRILLGFLVLLVHVAGYSHAPGTYPEEETRASDFEVPKNPYQSGWTGYEYYYEKEPKKMPSSGKMPAFQSIQSISTDRESPDDPEELGYKASGSESSGHKTTSPVPPPTTTAAPLVEVAPSSTTGTVSVSTSVPTTTTTTTGTLPSEQLSHTTTITEAPTPSPDTGDDLKAADNLAMYPGVQEEKDSHEYEPKNLLTTIIEKKKVAPVTHVSKDTEGSYDSVPEASNHGSAPGAAPISPTTKAPVPPITLAPKTPESSYDAVPEASSYEMAPKNTAALVKPVKPKSPVTLKSGDAYDDLGGPSGYADVVPTTTNQPKTAGSAPGTFLKIESTPTNPQEYGTKDTGYGNVQEDSAKISEAGFETTQNPEVSTTSGTDLYKSQTSSSISHQSSESDGYDSPKIPFKPSPVYMHTDSPNPNSDSDYTSYELPSGSEPSLSSPKAITNFTPSRGGYKNHKDTVAEPRGPYSNEDEPYPAPKIPMASRGETEDPYSSFSKPFTHIGTVPSSKFAPGTAPDLSTNSNNAISPRDPYDHFGTVLHHAPASRTSYTDNGDSDNFEDEQDSGYETNGVLMVPDRSTHHHSITTGSSSVTDVKAQISEIDRIAEAFENSAREPVEYEHKITSESSKGIIAEAGKDIAKKFGRKARKCCSCCDEKQPVSRQVETKIEPSTTQKLVSPTQSLGEEPVQNFVPLQSTVGGNAYIQPQQQPQPIPQQPQTQYQQPFQQYQPQYPQSYPYQQPQQSCGCQPQPQNCCAPPAPCCLPTIPCCPPIPCCPQPKICCQPQPICLPPPTCCQISFQLPTIPICGRACPSCPCRRRVHKTHRLKRHALNSNCNRCSAAGEPWKAFSHHREKRSAPGCSSGFSTMQQNSCSTCGASHLRSARVKRMGCLPCLGRKKRDTEENSHIRVKRMGCLPCLGRKKRSALSSNCSQCNSLGHLFNRYKRSLFGCSPCSPQPSCPCGGRKKRSVTMKIVKRAPAKNQCDASCCDYTKCPNRQKKDVLVPFM